MKLRPIIDRLEKHRGALLSMATDYEETLGAGDVLTQAIAEAGLAADDILTALRALDPDACPDTDPRPGTPPTGVTVRTPHPGAASDYQRGWLSGLEEADRLLASSIDLGFSLGGVRSALHTLRAAARSAIADPGPVGTGAPTVGLVGPEGPHAKLESRVAQFLRANRDALPSSTSILELLEWSAGEP